MGNQPNSGGLLRALGPFTATAIVVGTVIGSGVFKKPQIIAASVPGFDLVALVWILGGVLALWITETPFSISAAVGFVSVFGVAVQDGVLLISYFNQLRAAGLPVRESVMRGAELRVRPVVMTSLTAALGLLPAALATSIGSQAQKPLAVVVVGAMFCTLFLTRYMMPVLYSYFPNPLGHGAGEDDHLVEGTNYSRYFMHYFPEEEGAIPNSRPHENETHGGAQNAH